MPENATWLNFRRVLGLTSPEENVAAGGSRASMNFFRYLANSLFFVAVVVIGQVASSTMAAYAFARLRFRGREALFVLFLAGLMIPPIFIILPNFVLINELGWMDSFKGLIAPYFLVAPFGIFFLRQFFLGVPREIEEAAIIDGANRWRVFFKVVFPMMKAPVVTLAIIQAVTAWNEYLWPQLVGKSEDVRLLNVALAVFSQTSPTTRPDWSGLMAAATLQMIPMLLVLLLFGRQLVSSIGLTSAK